MNLINDEGWELSPLYDVNPDIYGNYLSLNVDLDNSEIDFELAISAAKYYGIDGKKAQHLVENIKNTVRDNWQKSAGKYGISRGEIERMKPAFRACEEYK